ncbi:MAG: hypothetical protein KDM81_08665, partial [Verrucomicrobiae bacterium]|nr:hypothetical protein [Verrucomicrobiae bacterium]
AGGRNDVVEIPVTLANVNGLVSAAFTVTFDASVLRPVGAVRGNLTPGWSLAANPDLAGELRVTMASPGGAVAGAGSLATLQFEVIGEPGVNSTLQLSAVALNDGTIPVETGDGSVAVNVVYDISGRVTYWYGDRPVPGVSLTLRGDRTFAGTSSADGAFRVIGADAGDYVLGLAKSDEANGIGALDASLVLRHDAGLMLLSGGAAVAADVNRSGAVTAMDAFYILQKAVDLIGLPFPGAGRVWDFDPASRGIDQLVGDLTGQDFTAILIGDVTGNWGAEPDPVRALALAEERSQGNFLSLRRQELPDGAARWWVVADLGQDDLYALDLILTPSGGGSLEEVQTRVADGAASFSLASNAAGAGSLRVAMASAVPVHGFVPLLRIELPVGEEVQFGLASFQANEGQVALSADLGGLRLDQDRDGDGLSDWSEVLAGTDALSGESRLRMLGVELLTDGRKRVRWSSIPGRSYHVQFKHSLADGDWSGLDESIPAAGETTSAEDPAASGQRFYRVVLQE